MGSVKFTLILFTFTLATVFEGGEASFKCWQQRCHECSLETLNNNRGINVPCTVGHLVNEHWLENIPTPPISSPNSDVDYACIKMVATDPSVNGDSTDIIRGCALRMTADQLCMRLTSVELARGKSSAKCYYCYGDSCNGAPGRASNGTIMFITASVLAIFYNKRI